MSFYFILIFHKYFSIFFLIEYFSLFIYLFTDTKLFENVFKFPKIKREKSRRSRDQVYVNGYRFVIASQSESTIYLKCANFRNKCNARASKRKDSGETFITKSYHAPGCVCVGIVDPAGLVFKDEASQ